MFIVLVVANKLKFGEMIKLCVINANIIIQGGNSVVKVIFTETIELTESQVKALVLLNQRESVVVKNVPGKKEIDIHEVWLLCHRAFIIHTEHTSYNEDEFVISDRGKALLQTYLEQCR